MHDRTTPRGGACTLPAGAGISLKAVHFAEARSSASDVAFFEVHAENHLGAGGLPRQMLEWIRRDHGLSIHGVGLSIGGPGPLDAQHLQRVANLVERHQPDVFSEHLAWSSHNGEFLSDLLPLPYTPETLERVCGHVAQVQDRLRRAILIENPASYVEFAESTLSEGEFISELVRRTGCGLLLDVSNALVSCTNHARDAKHYLQTLPLHAVGEVHLAGFAEDADPHATPLLVDTHDRAIPPAVWALYRHLLDRVGPVPTLLEWDNALPSYSGLLDEAARIGACIHRARQPGRMRAA